MKLLGLTGSEVKQTAVAAYLEQQRCYVFDSKASIQSIILHPGTVLYDSTGTEHDVGDLYAVSGYDAIVDKFPGFARGLSDITNGHTHETDYDDEFLTKLLVTISYNFDAYPDTVFTILNVDDKVREVIEALNGYVWDVNAEETASENGDGTVNVTVVIDNEDVQSSIDKSEHVLIERIEGIDVTLKSSSTVVTGVPNIDTALRVLVDMLTGKLKKSGEN